MEIDIAVTEHIEFLFSVLLLVLQFFEIIFLFIFFVIILIRLIVNGGLSSERLLLIGILKSRRGKLTLSGCCLEGATFPI